MSKKSSIHRTLEILKKLNKGDKISILFLSEEFEVSERTIRRDFKLIEDIFPNFIIKEEKIYYAINKKILNDVLHGKDLSILLNIIYLFKLSGNNMKLTEELQKIFDKNKNIYRFVNRPFETIKNKSIFIQIESAIINRRKCKIFYSNGFDNSSTSFIVKPYKILLLNENFYLFCESEGKYSTKLFRMGLIKEIETLSNNFYPKPDILKFSDEIQTPFSKFKKNVTLEEAIVSVPKEISKYFRMKKFLPSQKILETKDKGDLIISFKFSDILEVSNLVEQWLPKMKIIKPIRLKKFLHRTMIEKIDSLSI